MEPDSPRVSAAPPVTFDVALANAERLLQAAEVETNLALMERLEHLADTWVNIATLLATRDTI